MKKKTLISIVSVFSTIACLYPVGLMAVEDNNPDYIFVQNDSELDDSISQNPDSGTNGESDNDSASSDESVNTDNPGTDPAVDENQPADLEELNIPEGTDVITDLNASPYGNRMVELSWSYQPNQGAPDDYQYLIYRSEDGENFEKIGYTQKGQTSYIDAGGQSELFNEVEYFYKVQAYSTDLNHSSNLHYAPVSSSLAGTDSDPENEFSYPADHNRAVEYLRKAMVNRDSEAELQIWSNDTDIKGYSNKIFNDTFIDSEDPSIYNEGDYLWYNMFGQGMDADLTDNRITRNGQKLYTIHYTFTYYTSAEEEAAVEEKANEIIEELSLNDESIDSFEKVRRIYEYMSKDAVYDLSEKPDGKTRCSAYDALVSKRAVCQGFSNGAYYLLRKIGLDTRIIQGDVLYDGELRVHAWNLVEINGEWYNVCITTEVHLRESYPDYYGDVPTYRYLLKTDDSKYFQIFKRDPNTSGSDAFRAVHPIAKASYKTTISDENLKSPEGFSAEPKSGVTIRLNWQNMPGVSNYEIYRSVSEDGEYELFKTLPESSTSTSDTGLKAGDRYYYKIRAIKSNDDGITVLGSFSEPAGAVALAAPSLESASLNVNGVLLEWSKTGGAAGYNIYRSDNQNGPFEYLKSVNDGSLSCYDDQALSNQTYFYQIKAYKKFDEGAFYSQNSNTQSVLIDEEPVLSVSVKSSKTMSLSWMNTPKAYSYELWVSESGNSYQKVKAVSKTQGSTSHTDLAAGNLYSYKLAALDQNGTMISVSEEQSAATLVPVSVQSHKQTKTGIRLNWKAANNVDGYNIYRSESLNDSYEYIGYVNGENTLSFVDKSAQTDKNYYYKIRPYKRINDTVYYGDWSEAKTAVRRKPSASYIIQEMM